MQEEYIYNEEFCNNWVEKLLFKIEAELVDRIQPGIRSYILNTVLFKGNRTLIINAINIGTHPILISLNELQTRIEKGSFQLDHTSKEDISMLQEKAKKIKKKYKIMQFGQLDKEEIAKLDEMKEKLDDILAGNVKFPPYYAHNFKEAWVDNKYSKSQNYCYVHTKTLNEKTREAVTEEKEASKKYRNFRKRFTELNIIDHESRKKPKRLHCWQDILKEEIAKWKNCNQKL